LQKDSQWQRVFNKIEQALIKDLTLNL
jgi:hypothetical protein